jgi:hypothetical protein
MFKETDQSLSREDLEQFDEHLAIPQVDVQVLDAAPDAREVRVDPFGECLLLYTFTLICKSQVTNY